MGLLGNGIAFTAADGRGVTEQVAEDIDEKLGEEFGFLLFFRPSGGDECRPFLKLWQ